MTSIKVKPIEKQKYKFEGLCVGDIFKFNNNYYMKILHGYDRENGYFNSMKISMEEYMYFTNEPVLLKENDMVEPIKSELIIYDDEGVCY